MKYKFIAILSLFAGLVFVPATVGAVDFLPQCQTSQATVCKNDPGSNPITETIGKIARIIGFITGVAAVIMVIVGGISYTTSSGDPTKTSNARKTIIYAAVGLVISISAGTIAAFLTKRLF